MQTTPKANNILGHVFALLGAVVMLAIATWVSASSSQQIQPLDNLVVPRTGHTAPALSDGRILITGGRDTDGNLVAASEIFDPETQTSSASATLTTARVDHSATVLVSRSVPILALVFRQSPHPGPQRAPVILLPCSTTAPYLSPAVKPVAQRKFSI